MKQIRQIRPSWRVFAAGREEIAKFNRIAGSAPSAIELGDFFATSREDAPGRTNLANLFHGMDGLSNISSVPQDGVFLLSVSTIPGQWLMEPMEDIVNHVLASATSREDAPGRTNLANLFHGMDGLSNISKRNGECYDVPGKL
jgi:hypothetical protein